jgi:hypothetical protein
MGPGHSIPIGEGEVGPPQSGFVLRLCIRKADEARGEAALGHGLADTRFCRELNRFAVGQRLRPWSFRDSTSRPEFAP